MPSSPIRNEQARSRADTLAARLTEPRRFVQVVSGPQAGSTLARYVIEKSLETEFPGISFRDTLAGREAYLTGHRVAVWEVVAVHDDARSIEKTADHFGWPRMLVRRALAYARAFPDELLAARDDETRTAAPAR